MREYFFAGTSLFVHPGGEPPPFGGNNLSIDMGRLNEPFYGFLENPWDVDSHD